MKVRAVVPAAGVGRRFGTNIPKQYQPLAGKPILEHSITRLLASEYVEEVDVVLSPEDTYWTSIAADIRHRVRTCVGGKERADSVRLALLSMEGVSEDDWVLVHDAARPLLSVQLLDQMISSLCDGEPGVILAVPIQDTVKRESPSSKGLVAETLDRSFLWAAQTPQVFQYGLLRAALEKTAGNLSVTDEASAMEMCGHPVRLMMGDRQNLKITSQEDLQLGEWLWAQQTLKAITLF